MPNSCHRTVITLVRSPRGGHCATASVFKPRMLRRLYGLCIRAAEKPYAAWLLGIVSFAESSFFPVPPDVMLLPMSLARPDHAWRYATVCTATSVAGGLLGYFIGAYLYDTLGHWVMQV